MKAIVCNSCSEILNPGDRLYQMAICQEVAGENGELQEHYHHRAAWIHVDLCTTCARSKLQPSWVERADKSYNDRAEERRKAEEAEGVVRAGRSAS